VTTCVRCQDRLERTRRLGRLGPPRAKVAPGKHV
jgi:hypothetical protein